MKTDAPTVTNRRQVRTHAAPGLNYSRVSRVGRSYVPRAPRKSK